MSPSAGTRRVSLVGPIVLVIGFLAVVLAGIFTVLIPELTSDEALHEPAAVPSEDGE